ncbi:MAG TPA: phosphoglycerate dehydrogenase [Candidatus Limnocylindria bacterium]|nr:phosphoglycerate dehydrogenase [Candidatus Limnocylindria bacterium]
MQRTAAEWLASLTDRGIEVELPPVTQHVSRADLERLLPTCDGIIAGDEPLDGALLATAPRLRVISRWGVGLDNVDLGAARELGIEVRNTPAAFAEEVADVAIGYAIMLARGLHTIDAGARAGGWPKPQGVSLAGRTIGVIGLGAIGRAVARRGVAMAMRVVGTDPDSRAQAAASELGVDVVERESVFDQADVLSLNCPMTPENLHLLNADRLRRMPTGSFVVNTARGPLIDEAALVDALRSGHLAGAALDVFETEPLPSDSPLRSFPNVILGSHNASNTIEAVRRVNRLAIENLLAVLDPAPA